MDRSEAEAALQREEEAAIQRVREQFGKKWAALRASSGGSDANASVPAVGGDSVTTAQNHESRMCAARAWPCPAAAA